MATQKQKQSSAKPAVNQQKAADQCDGDNCRLLPVEEHYRGEPEESIHPAGPGSLEKETLDSDAPFNKTYGKN